MDPLSLAAGVTSLIGVCVKVGLALNDVRDGANLANAKVDGLGHEIKGFTQVLELMKSTMEDAAVQAAFQSTGRIANHWRSIAVGIDDGRQTLVRLHSIVQGVDKTVGVLDGTRKHFRLRLAASEIAIYQQKIRIYRDTMQMSIQTVILWNQVSHQESTDKILPGLDDLTSAIRLLALDMNAQIASLRGVVESSQSQDQLQSLGHMKKCVETAADVVSSASTTLGLSDRASVVAPSDFGDIFGSRSNEAVMRWIDASEEPGGEPALSIASTSTDIPRISEQKIDDSDSDGELEVELVEAQYRKGVQEQEAGNTGTAIQYFKGSLSRLRKNRHRSKDRFLEVDLLHNLAVVYWESDSPSGWLESKELTMEQLRIVSKWEPSPSTTFIYLEKTYQLATVLLKLNDTTQAEVYAKKCIKGFKKMRNEDHADCLLNALLLMVDICEASGDVEGVQAYKLLSLETRKTLDSGKSSLPHQLNEPNDPAINNESSDRSAPLLPSLDHTGFSSTSEQPVTRSREATVPSPPPGLVTSEFGQIRKTSAVNVLLLPAARGVGDFIARSCDSACTRRPGPVAPALEALRRRRTSLCFIVGHLFEDQSSSLNAVMRYLEKTVSVFDMELPRPPNLLFPSYFPLLRRNSLYDTPPSDPGLILRTNTT
ncbi:hypothetical protein B0H66DRAFT_395888 [Apodospora peruviana]|uniref:Fungal N-terminal domain-containing protein n=1 Tax=Apodospora peruviana TaxID=516989 RepID=A0AAE0HST4_9PEZI|nr:hypothetical protein B0H66DRAFT_395888 [Apodospora peruviana]